MKPRNRGSKLEIEALGDSALIIRFRDNSAAVQAQHRLENANIPGAIEYAAAYDTVALFYDPAAFAEADNILEELASRIETAMGSGAARSPVSKSRLVDVGVCFDEEFAFDLAHVAARSGLSSDKVINACCRAEYRVVCIGFTPGFPYLAGLPEELATPRRETPRTEVPAGSVAIAGTQAGIYPLASPGGWNIIGRTGLRLFDPRRTPPALLQNGDRVRFHAVTREEMLQEQGEGKDQGLPQ